MRRTLQLLLAASLCGCVATAPEPAPVSQQVSEIPISLALEETITIGIRQHLQDPVSAKFGTMRAGERTLDGRREILVCGHVAAKTSSGGHTTGQPFAAKIYPDEGSSFELIAMGDQSQNASVARICRAAGLPISEP
ncbi:hypothetical protein X747_31270 [Mesorhizobium sp. LNJC384A00]|uniref:hypothetical protein n=1 Tax=unclassified Mesorhizobium TaxID=325217 RepID=UPI0003CE1409|nr:hypothetical protein [Mesorhizobium sp. LSJC255A00]ESX26384.1 hypothetical protein X765_23015 [Mesorhizobium sp. LSHC440B00]ESX33117.1 hypothetical protein X763_26750 [Mesorhizobium sp. LSHC432A00]ESX38495.1 hypothetical protein X764_21695 [Mesorhizobium sp. LSHC440A00]ESX79810.1 hypothetical protein X757_05765 [Mesorhizobium sp. LSHC414A00]ESY21038.1 hypothetical protein X749_28890 [Mesorhizobium sp. LNJC391B00]ESY32136.1 hypothetical protein X747_31270 [Mesorhizobium sp. LNJC384A00]ESZ1